MTVIKKWPQFSGEKTEILKQLFYAGESMNLDNFVQHFTDDAVYQFSNFPIVHGPEGIREASGDFLKKVEGLHHHIKHLWELPDGTVICDLETTYIRYDGQVFTLPCCDIIRFSGNKLKELLIYMDITPVYNTPEGETIATIEQKSDGKLANLVKELFAAAYNNDLDKYLTFFTDDVVYKAGNAETVIGKEDIREFSLPVMQTFKTVSHDIIKLWEVGNTVICQAEVVYNRNDGKVSRIPTTNIIYFNGDKIKQLQAFGDPSLAFA